MILLMFSVISWGIIILKFFQIRGAQKDSREFLQRFWKTRKIEAVYDVSKELRRSPLSQVFRAGYSELVKIVQSQSKGAEGNPEGEILGGGIDNVERACRRATTAEITRLERAVAFLATTGSTAPFIGLFGTVWGIMSSFREIGLTGRAGLNVVAPGISEALVATAIGLFAAIPAVVAYNFFVSKIRLIASETENFAADFLNIVRRHFLK